MGHAMTATRRPPKVTPRAPMPCWIPAGGGHVTVRVLDYDVRAQPRRPKRDLLGRFTVVLRRAAPGDVRVLLHDTEIGRLPPQWARYVEHEILAAEARDQLPVARGVLAGPHAEDLHVLLAYPARTRN